MLKAVKDKYPLVLALLCCLAFLPFLGRVHLFDWDEINFAEISREMIVLGDYLRIHVNFEPFWEKPPFFFWLQVLAMQIAGVGEYAARLPNAICGIITIVLLYSMGRKLQGPSFGVLWALAYFGSVLPHFYFKTGIIDPWFNLFIFAGLYLFIQFSWKRQGGFDITLPRRPGFYLMMGGLSIGMAILTKGQVAFLVFGLCLVVHTALNKFRLPATIPQLLTFAVATLLVTLLWYGLETLRNGPWFIREFTQYQFVLFSTHSAGHAGFPGYHFVVNWFGCFPASVLALPLLFGRKLHRPHAEDFRKWMVILFWVVIVLFSIVQSKIVHYSSLVYFPLTFLAAGWIHTISEGRHNYNRRLSWPLAITGAGLGLAIALVPVVGRNLHWIADRVRDPFARANLQAEVPWQAWEAIWGILFLFVLALAVRKLHLGKVRQGFVILCLSTAALIAIVSHRFIPKMEGYTQRAAIEFFESLQDEDCYVDVLGYKSYAQYFYTRKKPQSGGNPTREWLLTGPLDKPAYFATKVHRLDEYAQYPGMEILYEKNGFVFLKREPAGQ